MIRSTIPAMAVCDGCGAEGEAHETRNRKTGALTAAFLPEHWKTDVIGGQQFHFCGECAAIGFDDRRDAFEARLDHFGAGWIGPIAASLGLPDIIAARWCAEWKRQQRDAA